MESIMSQKEHITVVAGVVCHDDQILITKRKRDTHLAGFWEFPGGKAEPGETEAKTLTRELAEELAIEVIVGELLERTRFDYPERTVSLAFYRCRLDADSPQPVARDVAEWRWVQAAELDKFPFPAANENLLKLLKG